MVGQLVPEFERRNPGIKVEVQRMPWTAAHEKLLTAHVGQATPDIAQVGNTWIPEFHALNAIEDLSARVNSSAGVKEANYFPGIWKTNQIDGSLYGVPWYVDTRVLFYRKDILANAGVLTVPRSWSEWIEGMRKIRRLGGKHRFAAVLPTDEWAQPVIFGFQTGSTILKNNGRYGAFQDAEFKKAFEFYVSLYHSGYAPVAANTQIANIYQQFGQGDFAMYITGPWNIGEFRRRLPAELRGKWDTAPLPAANSEEDYPGVSLAGGASIMMFRSSSKKSEAWKFIEYLSEPEQQVRFYELTGDLPSLEGAWNHPVLAGDPQALAFKKQLEHVVPMPQVPEWEQIATKIAEYAEEAIRRRRTVDGALAALDSDVNRMLEKRRWILNRQEAALRK